MMVALDELLRIGEVAVAALAECSVHYGCSHVPSILGTKHPVAVLVRRDDVTMAFEIDGSRIALDDFEQRFPGQRAEFECLATT